jgi:lipopolysaccharide transport system permease protein
MINRWNARQYIDFILYKSYADLKTEANRTYVGFMWWVVEPVLYMSIFYLVFALILKSRTDDFIAFLLVGLVMWRWFQSTIFAGGLSISQSRGVINQVYFPKLVLPLVTVVTNTVKFAFVFSLLLVFLWLNGKPPTSAYMALLLLLFTQLAFITGVTVIIAAVTPFLPDIRIILDNALRGLFFMSGIFFDIGEIDEPFRSYLFLNPMAMLIDNYRAVLIRGVWPDVTGTLVMLLISVLAVIVGVLMVKRFDHSFPRIV